MHLHMLQDLAPMLRAELLEGRYELTLLLAGRQVDGTLEIAGRRVLLSLGDTELVAPLLVKNVTLAFATGSWIFTGRRDAHSRLTGHVTCAGIPGRWLAEKIDEDALDHH